MAVFHTDTTILIGSAGILFGLALGFLNNFLRKKSATPEKASYEIEKFCAIAHLVINGQGRIIATNTRASALFGIAPQAFININIKQILHLDPPLLIALKQADEGQHEVFAYTRISVYVKNKNFFKILIKKLLFNGNVAYIIHLHPLKNMEASQEAVSENKQLRRLMHQAPVGMLEISTDYRVRYCNLAMLSFFKCSSFEEVFEMRMDQLLDSRAWLPFQAMVESAIQSRNGLADGTLDQGEPQHVKKYHIQIKVLFNQNHQPSTIIATFQSISHWYQQEQLLLSLNNYFKQYFDLLDKNIFLIETDSTFSITFVSQGLCQKIGNMNWEWIGYPLFSLFSNRQQTSQQKSLLQKVLAGQRGQIIVKKRLPIKNKIRSLWLRLELLPKHDQNLQIQGISIIAQDITAQKRLELLSQIDPMTKLYNRRLFYTKVEQLVRSDSKSSFTFCLLDIDFFKLYNDTYGHPAGDRAITAVANVLRQQAKKARSMAFRLGGEEFALLLVSQDKQEHIAILEDIRQRVEGLAIPHEKNKASAFLTISMGAQWHDYQQPKRLEDLYDDTDQALYQAKTTGRNRLVLFQLS